MLQWTLGLRERSLLQWSLGLGQPCRCYPTTPDTTQPLEQFVLVILHDSVSLCKQKKNTVTQIDRLTTWRFEVHEIFDSCQITDSCHGYLIKHPLGKSVTNWYFLTNHRCLWHGVSPHTHDSTLFDLVPVPSSAAKVRGHSVG